LIGWPEYHGIDIVLLAEVLVLIVSYFVTGAWIYQAHANLRLVDVPQTEFTPGWAIGWFAVPIANLFKPFQAMKTLWRISHSEDPNLDRTAPGIMWFWWLTWLLSGLTAIGSDLSGIDVIYSALTCFSAVTLILIIRQITSAQPTMSVARTFE